MTPPDADDEDEAALLERLRATTELLERIAADWGLLDRLPAEARQHFHRAVALMANPVPKARRKTAKALKRTRKAAAATRDETMLGETGIRALRRKPVITTPNVFPPRAFEPRDLPPGVGRIDDRDASRRSRARQRTRGAATSASRTTRSSIISTITCARRARS